MTHDERRLWLIKYLLDEDSSYKDIVIPRDEDGQWRLLRSLMNMRPAAPVGEDFLAIQDAFLQEETRRKGITDIGDLSPCPDGLILWQGDITTLRCDAIVNAANSGMTGCYVPCHGCIDNAIHTYAGVQLRDECAALMEVQGHDEETGKAKITRGWNLPASYVIHTVGPIVRTVSPTGADSEGLASCYRSCLELAHIRQLESIAFCCISTGEFHFPSRQAARIAVDEVKRFLNDGKSHMKVVFNVFKDEDRRFYEGLLARD